MNIIKNKGQTAIGTILITSIATSAIGYFVPRILQSPDKANAAIIEVNTKLEKLCTDYGNTISRIDDNTQAIGKALKINVTSGRAGSNPCHE